MRAQIEDLDRWEWRLIGRQLVIKSIARNVTEAMHFQVLLAEWV